jgi:Ca2+-binding RTX toxin-like protein
MDPGGAEVEAETPSAPRPATTRADLEGLSGKETRMTTTTLTNGNDTFTGSSGADRIFGLDGNDRLNGADGNDVIDGGNGNDFLQGGFGSDTLTGGAGRDTFRWDDFGTGDTYATKDDVVTDFARGDKIDIRQVDVSGYDPSHTSSPGEGEWSIWGGGHFVTWNTHGEYHDVHVLGQPLTTSDVLW